MKLLLTTLAATAVLATAAMADDYEGTEVLPRDAAEGAESVQGTTGEPGTEDTTKLQTGQDRAEQGQYDEESEVSVLENEPDEDYYDELGLHGD